MRRLTRRQFAFACAAVSCSRSAVAAPFVPSRDPQVVAFAPGGTMIATGCSGLSDGSFPPRPHPDVRKCGVVAVWDVASRKRLFRWETYGDLIKLAFSPDGTLLAACRLFETEDGIALHEVRLWDVTSGRLVKALDRCHGFDFSPDSRQLAIISRTKCVIYDLEDWAKEKNVAPLGGALSISFAANGLSLVAIVRDDAKYRVRQAAIESTETFSPSLVLDQPFYRVAGAPDGSLLATGHEEGHVLLWDPATLDLKSRLQTGERGLAHPFFSPDAQLLAAGSQATGDVVIWNLADRQEVARYTFEKGSFRPFYNRAASATFRPERDPTRFCFSPNGDLFLAGCYGGILRATRGGQEIARFGE